MISPPHVSGERLALVTGGLLMITLCFLDERTVDSRWRAVSAMSMFIAAACAGTAAFLEERGRRHNRARLLAATAMAAALFLSTVGYVTVAYRTQTVPSMTGNGGQAIVTNTIAAATSTTSLKPTPVVAPPVSGEPNATAPTDTVTTITRTTGTTTGVEQDQSKTKMPPPSGSMPRPDGALPWIGLSALSAIGAVFAFSYSRSVTNTRAAVLARTAGITLGALSITASGWKLLELDGFIKSLEVAFTWREAPASTATEFDVLYSTSIGPFEPGDIHLNTKLYTDLLAARDKATHRGDVVLAIIIGHVDKRALSPATALRYSSNQGLALRRAMEVSTNLKGIHSIVSIGGPTETGVTARVSDFDKDRRVEVCFLGRRSP